MCHGLQNYLYIFVPYLLVHIFDNHHIAGIFRSIAGDTGNEIFLFNFGSVKITLKFIGVPSTRPVDSQMYYVK